MTTSIQQRRENILASAYRSGHVNVRQLSEGLGVSEATIRRDLHGLASEGLLELNHGGASVIRGSDYSFLSKSMRNVEAKHIIAELAAQLVADGEQLFLDSGSTCYAMAAFLRSKRGLSVIVNSVRTAQELNAPGINVLILGGQYRPDRVDTIGPMASASLDKLRGYLAFVGTDGLGMDFGLTAIDIESAHIFGQAVKNARQSILLADSSKFDAPGLYKIANWTEIAKVITEKRPSDAWCEFFASQHIELIYPQANPCDPHNNPLGDNNAKESNS
ncbi:MAG TPA: DeoR/GlpR family DNA-binding transcription regulator [Anaerohalosphaeraceae bacterium]|nr:DeoR/GlpR family DNA-binding transcription regulator [Anaerohalosphaeraceae bacterium]